MTPLTVRQCSLLREPPRRAGGALCRKWAWRNSQPGRFRRGKARNHPHGQAISRRRCGRSPRSPSARRPQTFITRTRRGRFGLGSFKALGGAYAVFRLAPERDPAARTARRSAPGRPGGRPRLADLVAGVTVSCATDGNHGRSVAWGARLFGCRCVIYVHATVSDGRARAIADLRRGGPPRLRHL